MPAVISGVTEEDFVALAKAAWSAKERGDHESARLLDKLARKASASLTNQKTAGMYRFVSPGVNRITWLKVPSTLLQKVTV